MRRVRLMLLGGLVVLAPLGFSAAPAAACDKPINNSCGGPTCKFVAPDVSSGELSPIECYY
jgi:hypothetical protein